MDKIFSYLFVLAVAVLVLVPLSESKANPEFGKTLGPQACEKCHSAETAVWEGSAHSKSYKDIHRNKNAKKIVKSIGEKRMKKSQVCAMCHYTLDSDSGKPAAGPSCESCHGGSEKWLKVHNDYGAAKKRENESAAQRKERVAKATKAGMLWPHQLYDVAANCMSCHGLANSNLSAENASAMLDNGHPLNPNFEIVEYSQGTVRHRFYPPDQKTNQTMDAANQSRLYVVGQMAALVSATEAISKTDHAAYKAAQVARIDKAKSVLNKVAGKLPGLKGFISKPSASAGRDLAEKLKSVDVSAEISGLLPSTFK